MDTVEDCCLAWMTLEETRKPLDLNCFYSTVAKLCLSVEPILEEAWVLEAPDLFRNWLANEEVDC